MKHQFAWSIPLGVALVAGGAESKRAEALGAIAREQAEIKANQSSEARAPLEETHRG